MRAGVLLVVLAACAERGSGGLSEEEFWQQNAGFDSCYLDNECVIALEPCDACPIAVSSSAAAQFRRQAMEVECTDDGEDLCTTNEFLACDRGRCALLESKPEPTCAPDFPWFWSACNAIADTGCDAGEKCTWFARSLDPLLMCTSCAPSGPKLEGQHCIVGPALVDDCAGGLICMDGYCTEVCDALDNTNCDADETCIEEPGYFEDAENTGACQR
jgi:hypothetical protein